VGSGDNGGHRGDNGEDISGFYSEYGRMVMMAVLVVIMVDVMVVVMMVVVIMVMTQ
jgi:hypothetical protein